MFKRNKIMDVINSNEVIKKLYNSNGVAAEFINCFVLYAYNEIAERSEDWKKYYYTIQGCLIGAHMDTMAITRLDTTVEEEAKKYLEERKAKNEPYQAALAEVPEMKEEDDCFPEEPEYKDYLEYDEEYIKYRSGI